MRGHGPHRRGRRRQGRLILQPALLLMMQMGPAHGYELMERLKEFGLENVDPSVIYRALHALENEGLVTSTWDEKESQGPPRRIYALAKFGKQEISHYLDDLKAQRDRIDSLLNAYDDHMRKDVDEIDNQ